MEYRQGYYKCADCGVDLVYELPAEGIADASSIKPDLGRDADLVFIYETFNPADVMLVKSLLEAEGIIYNFQGELFKGSSVFIAPAMLYVANADAQKVQELLRDHGIT
ncbi:MAG: DUF2007 domain-containing protein [Pseudomonadota bacterium]